MAGLNELVCSNRKFQGGKVLSMETIRQQQMNMVDYLRIPTGVFALDYAVGGGIPLNVITQFYGPNQGGKTTAAFLSMRRLKTFCMRCMRPQAMCTCSEGPMIQKAFLAQFEGMPPDQLYLETLSYDPSGHMMVGMPDSGEEGCEMICAAAKADDCGLIVVDSLAGIVPKAELEASFEDSQVAAQSRLIAKLFRKLSCILVQEHRRGHRIGVVFLNQIRTVIGAGKWEPNETTPGGFASKHGYRLSVRLNQLSADKEKGEQSKDDMLKNVMRFSASLQGPSSKQQLLVLAGKAEYKVVVREWNGYDSGTTLDMNAVIAVSKDHKLLVKLPHSGGYQFVGLPYVFRVLSDIERVFQTNEYVDANGEVHQQAADCIKHEVLTRAKAMVTQRIREKMNIDIQQIDPVVDPNDAGPAESFEGNEGESEVE